jgi:NADPH:quinone reductase-like Zn-dependent oxidoreductase
VKAIHFLKTGDLKNLTFIDLPTPIPNEGEALIQIKAARLNKNDLSNVMGRMPYTTAPRTPGRDYAGVVVQGPEAWLGQSVWGTGCDNGFTIDGSHAEFMKVPLAALSLKPQNLSFIEAANCGTPFITAWHALEQSEVQSGTTLAIIGANGAVGHAATELATARGAKVLTLVRKPEQATHFASQGIASAVLPSADANSTSELKNTIHGHFGSGAKVIFDTTGSWLAPSIASLDRHGCVAVIVAPGNGEVNISVRDLYRSGSSIEGVNSLLYNAAECAKVLDLLRPLFEVGQLRAAGNIQAHPLSQGISVFEALSQGVGGQHVFFNPSE